MTLFISTGTGTVRRVMGHHQHYPFTADLGVNFSARSQNNCRCTSAGRCRSSRSCTTSLSLSRITAILHAERGISFVCLSVCPARLLVIHKSGTTFRPKYRFECSTCSLSPLMFACKLTLEHSQNSRPPLPCRCNTQKYIIK